MSRFTLHRDAAQDLDGIIAELRTLPKAPALKIGSALQVTLAQIAQRPLLGREYKNFNRDHGFAVRSRLSGKYKIFYRTDLPIVEIVAVLHTSRDVDSIMHHRLS